jgi:type II protein arginine methyltransferase
MFEIFKLIRDIFKRSPATGTAQDRQGLQAFEAALARDPHNPALLFDAARSYAAAGQRAEAIDHCRAALSIQPDFSAASITLALLLRQSFNVDEAIQVLTHARSAAPNDPEVLAHLRQMLGSGRVPMWHFSMMNDRPRNQAYERAIRATVRQGDHVLEIGTGSGLLAMMAARAGAGHVSSCEMVVPIADKARQIIEQNGYAERVTVIAKESTLLQVPEDLAGQADVLVAEVIASDLLGEGMLDSYDDARARLLKPGARIVPCAATVMGRLAGADELARFTRVGDIAGFDLQGFNDFTPVTLFPEELGLRLATFSAPFAVFDFDLQSDRRIPAERRAIAVSVTASGLCYGVLQWIRLELAPGVHFENAPHDTADNVRAGHWRQTLYTFPQPLQVQNGQVLHLVAAHDRNSLMFYCAF